MPQEIDLEETLRLNPKIDREKLKECKETQKRLREAGREKRGYQLVPPYGGKQLDIRDISELHDRFEYFSE